MYTEVGKNKSHFFFVFSLRSTTFCIFNLIFYFSFIYFSFYYNVNDYYFCLLICKLSAISVNGRICLSVVFSLFYYYFLEVPHFQVNYLGSFSENAKLTINHIYNLSIEMYMVKYIY